MGEIRVQIDVDRCYTEVLQSQSEGHEEAAGMRSQLCFRLPDSILRIPC